MKKWTILAFGAMLVAGSALSAAAVTTITFPISVTVISADIDIVGNTDNANAMAFGAVGAGTTVYSQDKGKDKNEPIVAVINQGYKNITLSLSQVKPAAWTIYAGGGQAGTVIPTTSLSNYRLSGVFTNYFGASTGNTAIAYKTLTVTDFGPEDAISDATAPATHDKFGVNSQDEVNLPYDGIKGYNIPYATPGSEYLGTRNLRFALDTPPLGSAGLGVAQTINVVVLAQ